MHWAGFAADGSGAGGGWASALAARARVLKAKAAESLPWSGRRESLPLTVLEFTMTRGSQWGSFEKFLSGRNRRTK